MKQPYITSSPSTSNITTGTPGGVKRIFSEEELNEFLNKFFNFLSKMQLEKAKEIVESERSKILFPTNRFWQFVLSAMSQVLIYNF